MLLGTLTCLGYFGHLYDLSGKLLTQPQNRFQNKNYCKSCQHAVTTDLLITVYSDTCWGVIIYVKTFYIIIMKRNSYRCMSTALIDRDCFCNCYGDVACSLCRALTWLSAAQGQILSAPSPPPHQLHHPLLNAQCSDFGNVIKRQSKMLELWSCMQGFLYFS